MALVPLGALLFLGWPEAPLPKTGDAHAVLSTMVFAAIVVMQMANAFECRSTPASIFSIGPFTNRLLVGAVVVEAIVLLAFVYVPPIRAALGQAPLEPAQWALVLGTPWVLLGLEEARKAVIRARQSRGHSAVGLGRTSLPVPR
jgi:magnesium-transporting ATPase (P-type)